MQVIFDITRGETVTQVKTRPVNEVAFERQYGRGLATAFAGDDLRMEQIYWLAWHAEKTTQKTDLQFDDWCAAIDEIELSMPTPATPLDPVPATG